MTKEVVVTIEGLQLGENNDRIATKASGLYQFQNEKHYIRYDEMIEGVEGAIKNIIKIAPDQVSISKKGAANTTMTFQLGEVTSTNYHTPYGTLLLQIKTTQMRVEEDADQIDIHLEYTISADENILSRNRTLIKIQSQ